MRSRESTPCACENCRHFNISDLATWPENDWFGKPRNFTFQELLDGGVENARDLKPKQAFWLEKHQFFVIEVGFDDLYAYESKNGARVRGVA